MMDESTKHVKGSKKGIIKVDYICHKNYILMLEVDFQWMMFD